MLDDRSVKFIIGCTSVVHYMNNKSRPITRKKKPQRLLGGRSLLKLNTCHAVKAFIRGRCLLESGVYYKKYGM